MASFGPLRVYHKRWLVTAAALLKIFRRLRLFRLTDPRLFRRPLLFGQPLDEAFRMRCVGSCKRCVAPGQHFVGFAVVEYRRRRHRDVTVPVHDDVSLEEDLTEAPGILDRAGALRKARRIFQHVELALRILVVNTAVSASASS